MSTYLHLVQVLTTRFHERIKKSCAPLFNCLNLNHFWYYKIRNDGGFAFFDSNVAWCEYYGAEKLYLNHPYLRHPRYHREGVYFLKTEIKQELNPSISFSSEFQFVNKIPEGIEAFGFSSACSTEMQTSLFVNELSLLKLFAKKFREDNSIVFSHLEDNLISLVDLIGPSFYKNDMLPTLDPAERALFLKKMRCDASSNLSSNEINVIKLLLKGHSASQIASHLLRSKRTVEHQIERIKEKTNTYSKAELIQKARELEDLNYLI